MSYEEEIGRLTHGEIESWLEEHDVSDFPDKELVPDDINPENTSLDQVFEYEQNRLNNDRRKIKFYFYCLQGWEQEANYCECGARHWYDCSCSEDKRTDFYGFVKKQQLDLLDAEERYDILHKMKSRYSEDDSLENISQVLTHFPLLKKKLIHMAE